MQGTGSSQLEAAEITGGPGEDRVVILGLGNTILRDDGLGILAARELGRRLAREPVTVRELPWGGFSLLDALAGFDWVIVIDAIESGQSPPGTLTHWAVPEACPGRRVISPHDMSIFTALELGRQLGLEMPRRASLFTVEALDARTVSEGLTPPVADAVGPLIEAVIDELSRSGALGASQAHAALVGASI